VRIQNPFILLIKLAWFPFGKVLSWSLIRFLRNDKCWGWFRSKLVEYARWDSSGEALRKMDHARMAMISGASFVDYRENPQVLPEGRFIVPVEKSQSEQARIESEAKTK